MKFSTDHKPINFKSSSKSFGQTKLPLLVRIFSPDSGLNDLYANQFAYKIQLVVFMELQHTYFLSA